ncbi:MAG TPA: hypothetical protein ENH43_02655 [Phycisphaerales bacterium]|nr:hypothetical protein [Phycisphaerales bacterium]
MNWYWFDSPVSPIRFIAAGFGFGPRVAAENLADDLGLTIDRWHSAKDKATNSFRESRLLLNFGVVDPDWASIDPKNKVFIDCLMWLRDRQPDITSDYKAILAETFFPTQDELRGNPAPVIDIQPLIANLGSRDPNQKERLVISFGGVNTPFSTHTHRIEMPLAVIEAFDIASQHLQSEMEVMCFLPVDICEEVGRGANLSHVKLHLADRKHFRDTLRKASAYVIQPGLYGPLEAFRLGIPTHFVFPMSYTQCCQLNAFRNAKLLRNVPLLDSMEDILTGLSRDVDEAEPTCFQSLERWWNEQNSGNLRDEFNIWAETVISNASVPGDLTEKRYRYAKAVDKKPTALEVLAMEGLLP